MQILIVTVPIISDIEKSLAVIFPLFWEQDSKGTSEWEDS